MTGALLPGAPPGGEVPFAEALDACVAARRADGHGMSVLLIDCGLIGRIDAAWGYAVGDAVRESIAESLRADVLRPGDFVGTVGRDELACVLASVDDPSVPLLAAEKSLRDLNAPLWVGEEEVFPRAAIGFALYPADGEEAGVLLQRARGACAAARAADSRIARHSAPHQAAVEQALIAENRLRTAVMEDALELAFQPQFDLKLGPIMGAQIHFRWRDPAAGALTADAVFAAAEAADVVTAMVSSILNRALRNVSEFRYSAGLDLRLCMPLPARALLRPDLPEVVQRALGTWNLRPGRLVLQVGDTAVLAREAQARETLLALKKIGVRLAIDDPGMALTSLFLLAGLPFQEIRLDMAAAGQDSGAQKSARILGAVIELAHQLGLDVVACGVADEAAADQLKELGCDYLQADFKGQAFDPEGFVKAFG